MGGQSSSLPTVLPEEPSHAPEHAELGEIRKYLNHGGSAAPCRDPSFALIDGTWGNDLERQGLTVIGMIIPCAFDELRGIIRYHGAGNQPPAAAAGLAFIDADKTMVDYVGPRSWVIMEGCVGSVTSRTVVNEELVALGLPRDSLTPGAVVAMQVITLDSEGGGVYCSAEENAEIFERFCNEGGRVIIHSGVGEVWGVVFKMYHNLDRIQSSTGCAISGEGNGTIEAEEVT